MNFFSTSHLFTTFRCPMPSWSSLSGVWIIM